MPISIMRVKIYLLVVLVMVNIGWVITSTWVGYRVRSVCIAATQIYSGGCVEALTKVVDEEKHDGQFRNRSVWALGQLGDQRALSVLQKHYQISSITAQNSNSSSLNRHDLQASINLIKQSHNITALWWRTNTKE